MYYERARGGKTNEASGTSVRSRGHNKLLEPRRDQRSFGSRDEFTILFCVRVCERDGERDYSVIYGSWAPAGRRFLFGGKWREAG